MTIALFEDNEYFIQSLKNKLDATIVPFNPVDESVSSMEKEVRSFIEGLRQCENVFFLINLESGYTHLWKVNFMGLQFFRYLIKEFGSSNDFNYCLYSFLSIDSMKKMNDYAFFVKKNNHKILPFNFHEIITGYEKNQF